MTIDNSPATSNTLPDPNASPDCHPHGSLQTHPVIPPARLINPYTAPRETSSSGKKLLHSGIGIASFCISLIPFFGVAPLALYMLRFADETDTMTRIMLGYAAAGLFLLSLATLGLGIAGVLQRQRRRFFAMAGLVLSGIVLLFYVYGIFLVLNR